MGKGRKTPEIQSHRNKLFGKYGVATTTALKILLNKKIKAWESNNKSATEERGNSSLQSKSS